MATSKAKPRAKTLAQITVEYNKLAPKIGAKPVKKFRDKATAEARLADAIKEANAELAAPVGDRADFNLPGDPKNIKEPRAGTLRKRALNALEKGCTMDKIVAIVEDFDKEHGKTSNTVPRRAYELVRLISTQNGYPLKQEGDVIQTA